MDFSFTEEQEAVRELASRIFSDLATHERLKEIESTDDRFDAKLWGELASAGLLGIWLPESVGGAGLGFVAAAIVAEEAGRRAAAVPVVASTVLGAGPIAR
ncbi:MAG TPA: acyl-CoA dehydrogenase family protein, partial [Acidimicrobiales bacterium]|nr:acyl-CoA dehydrogenase family protein [Acidimicrobiales bacterium]